MVAGVVTGSLSFEAEMLEFFLKMLGFFSKALGFFPKHRSLDI